MRKIIHVDMDAFFASIEQRDNSEYQGKPLAVGYAGERGVVASASYEARRYGVRSAMSSKMALKRCPHLIFVPSRFDAYHYASEQIMNIFLEYTDLVEPLSLDEAFLDVTQNYKNLPYATDIAVEIRSKIFKETKLTASAGISYNKFLAKIASDYKKPNGQFVIKPKDAEKFVENLAIENFFGVGKVTAKKMYQLGIKTGLDLKMKSEIELVRNFGKSGHIYYQNARAIDNRTVEPERIRKSVGTENTFSIDKYSLEEVYTELDIIAKELAERIKEGEFQGRTITLKAKYTDFKTVTRSRTISHDITDYETIKDISSDLAKNIDISKGIRLLGLSIKNSEKSIWQEAVQLTIDFGDDFSF